MQEKLEKLIYQNALQNGFSHSVQKKGFLVQKANVHTGSHAWSCKIDINPKDLIK